MSQALKYDAYDNHIEEFVFTINRDKNLLISGGKDCLIKIFDLNTKTFTETIDVNDEVEAICYGKGKLFYGQGNNLQMALFDSDSKFNPKSSILLTNFSSNVRKIVFNEKLNMLVAFSEDDDIHIISLNNLDVFKYKSQHEGSLKNMQISHDGIYLITTGCDGFMSVYEFDGIDIGKIIHKKKFKLCQKLNFESPQVLDVDINSLNSCAVGGNIILRTLYLNKSISNENLMLVHENSISQKDDINFTCWIDNHILVTSDLSNTFKIWNFTEKSCKFHLDTISNDNAMIKDNLNLKIFNFYTDKEKDNFYLIFGDQNGKLNISEKISFSKFNGEVDKNKFNNPNAKYKPNIEENNVNSQIEDFLKEFSKEVDQSEKNMKTDELLNLSDVEDENGEIKNQEEIDKAKEDRKLHQNKVEAFSDEIIGSLPQLPFISSSTGNKELNNTRFLCWNLIGNIVSRQENSFKAIDFSFADLTNKKKITYINSNDLSLGVMNNCGAFLASRVEEENEDEYEKEDERKNSVIEFKSIHSNVYSMVKDWSITLPAKENPISLAIGVDWCAVYTNLQNLRVFSLFGNQKHVISLPQVIAMTGHENFLVYVYHSSVPLFGQQMLRFKILDANNIFNEIYDGILPISPEATLTWFGFSEDGILLTVDSKKIIRGFFYGICNNWIPLLDLEEVYSNSNINFWMLGMQDEEIYGLELKGFLEEPLVSSKLPVKTLKVNIPFIINKKSESNNNEEENLNATEQNLFSQSLFIKHYQNKFDNFNFIKTIRNVRNPDYYYTDNLQDESDIHKRKVEHDKLALQLINNCFYDDKIEKIIGLFDSLFINSSRTKAIKICEYHDKKNLVNVLLEKMQIYKLKEENENLKKQHYLNNNFAILDSSPMILKSTTKNNIQLINNFDNKNIFSSLALDVDNLRAIEEEVRNDLGYGKEGSDEINSLKATIEASLNLEKKNSNPFLRAAIDTNNSKSNLNIFEDLSRTMSGGNLPNNKTSNINPNTGNMAELSFKNVNQKIGFKRKNNEINCDEINNQNELAPMKKMKKN